MSESFPLVRVVSTIVSTITNDVTEGLYIGDYLTLSSGTITNTSPLYNLKSGYGMELLNSTVSSTILELFAGTGIGITNGTLITNTSPLSDLAVGQGLVLSNSTIYSTLPAVSAGTGITISNSTIANTSPLSDLKTGVGLVLTNSTIYSTLPAVSAGNGINITTTSGTALITNTNVTSLYESSPYHGAYPYMIYSPYYLHPSRIGGLYINSVSATTLTVPNTPNNVAITPDGKYAYVSASGGAYVSVIDIISNNISTTITLSASVNDTEFTNGIAVTPDNKYVYVVCYGDNNVYVIDINSNSIVSTIGVGTNPYGICLTPNALFAYVSNYSSTTISVINTVSNSIFTTINIPTSISPEICITPDGQTVYIGGQAVYAIDTVMNNISATIAVSAGYSFMPTPNGNFIYAGNDTGGISVITTLTNTSTISISSIDGNVFGIAITPDDKYAYAGNYTYGTLSVIDIETNNTSADLYFGTLMGGIAITPDGKSVYAISKTSTLNLSIITAAVPKYTIQNLTASTTTSTLGIGSITFTSAYTGTVYIDAVVRGSNSTIGDGITIALLSNGSTLDSETYTQEGLAGNDHTFSLYYNLQVSANSSYIVGINAVSITGGDAIAKLTKLRVSDQW